MPNTPILFFLVPVAARTPIARVMESARRYALKRRDRVNLSYVCISSENVGVDDARALASIIGDTPVRLDLLGALALPTKPRQLEIGCIIGATGTRFGFLPLLGSDNDGLVLTSEAALEGSTAQLSLVAFRGLMPFSGRIARAAITFLAHGTFDSNHT